MTTQNLWAKLISFNGQEHVNFDTDSNEVSVEGKWRIERRLAGDVWITNLSTVSFQVSESWLETNQEMQLFGGERLAFCQNKKKQNISFDYIFCPMNLHSQNELKRNREDESSASSNQASQKLIKMDNVIKEEAQCSICMDTLYRCATVNPCGHSFCGHCLIGHLRNSPLCPLCNRKIKSVIKHSAFHNIIEVAVKNSPNSQRSSNEGIIPFQKDLEGEVHINGKEIFIGLMITNRKEGRGTLVSSDGEIYQCVWKNGLKEGEGVRILKNGTVIKGSWSHDFLQSHVEIKYVNGNTYKGETKGLKEHGKGVYKYHNGEVYEGDFKEGFFEGFGKYSYENGDVYQGEWRKGEMNGSGVMEYSDGDVYKGKWKDGIREGYGVLYRNNGDKFEGSWVNDYCNGMGKYQWAKGAEYEGNYTDSFRNGNGTMKYSNGDIFTGEWEKSKRHGKGVLILKEGDKIEGHWIDGVLQPMVKIVYRNGSSYEGKVKDETFEKHGEGVLIFSNGGRYDGHWKDDREIGKGKFISECDERKYEEFWEKGRVRDLILTFADGTKYKATFEEVKEVEEKQVKGRKKKQNCK